MTVHLESSDSLQLSDERISDMRKTRVLAALLASPLVLTSTLASADLTGLYVGGGLGVFGSYDFEHETKFERGTATQTRVEYDGYSDYLTNADLLAGYGVQVDSFYFGGEVAYSFGMSDEDILDYDRVLNEDPGHTNSEAGDTIDERSTTVEAGDPKFNRLPPL